MSLDAMDWVWTKSASKGTSRLVLLVIADKCPSPDATAYAGTAMLVQRTNASRTAVKEAVDKLIASGELAVVEGARGPRGETVYRLPRAVGHTRGMSDEPGFERAGFRPGTDSDPGQVPAPRGTDSGPAGGQIPTPGGTDSGPQNARNTRERKEQQQPRASAPVASGVTEALRPLAAALDAAGVGVRWSLGLGEQRDIWRLVQRHGAAALVELAAHRTAPGDAPKPARYWLRVWGDLDRAPVAASPGSNVVPFRPTTAPVSHTDTLAAGLALLEQEGLA
ncbi:hypothetical protein ACFP1Z_09280 [Streptomyces gamaensis]|uniref:Helix-turn-helix domain-containing protein n=1 Tax=Streptomyces gamaensis TaxID=1763542 RepID=A0ABW0YXU7_9ACTN